MWFFYVGYTLDRPASGDWMLTNRFLKEAGDRLKARSEAEIRKAMEAGLRYLTENPEYLGISKFFSFRTYSCYLGVFKPDRRMYLDALEKGGVPASKNRGGAP